MASNALVSIAMATYNGGQFLQQQLYSIYNQTYKNIEVIATDDGSTDRTLEVLQEHSREYGLKYYRNERSLGYSQNFGKAASLCTGDYIAFCDQDDVWVPNKIETLVSEINGYSLIYSDATVIDENSRTISESYRNYANMPCLFGKPFPTLLFTCFIRGFQILVTRELLRLALPIPVGTTHDDWLSIAATQLNGIKYLDAQLVHYRQHSKNVTGRLQPSSVLRELYALPFTTLCRKSYSEQRRAHCQQHVAKLAAISDNPLFSSADKALIQEIRTYWEDRVNSLFHVRAFAIALKHYKHISPHDSQFLTLKSILASLIRP